VLPELKSAVTEISELAKRLGLEIVLVGGLVAEFTSEIDENSPTFPRTRDADFAFCAIDWPQFQKLKEELANQLKFHPDVRIEHRLKKGDVLVDLFPYGPGIAPEGTLVWPGSKNEFNVIGFDEACASAVKAQKPGIPPVSILTIPGFVLLKIIAFLDRKEQNSPKHKNDADGIYYWLKNYADDERRFDVPEGDDPEERQYATAGAVLLGMEVKRLASAKAAIFIERFVSEAVMPDNSFVDAVTSGRYGELSERIREELPSLIVAFKHGYILGKKPRSKRTTPSGF
jgi:predicted nucleotidyltransferase